MPETAEADPREVAETDRRLEDLLEQVAAPSSASPALEESVTSKLAHKLVAVGMRTAHPIELRGRKAVLRCRGIDGDIEAELAPGLASELVALAVKNGDAVVVECDPGAPPLVVGVLQTRIPEELTLRARKVHIEADDELLLRSGTAAMRLRRDGDVELVGSRIAAMSRGLFRLVGRVLRLN